MDSESDSMMAPGQCTPARPGPVTGTPAVTVTVELIAPSLPFQGDQAVDAHAPRAPPTPYSRGRVWSIVPYALRGAMTGRCLASGVRLKRQDTVSLREAGEGGRGRGRRLLLIVRGCQSRWPAGHSHGVSLTPADSDLPVYESRSPQYESLVTSTSY